MSWQADGAVQKAWVSRYNGSRTAGTNEPVAALLDRTNNLIIAGSATSTNGDFDYAVWKYQSDGSLLWAARHGSASGSNDHVKAMCIDETGNVYVTGTSGTVKWSSAGGFEWLLPYAGTAIVTDNSHVYVTGFSTSSFATVKISASEGTNIWVKTFTYLGGPDQSQVMALDRNTNLFVAGSMMCYSNRNDRYWNRVILGYDGTGNLFWQTQVFPCYYKDVNLKAMASDPLGAIYVTGNLNPPFTGGGTYATRKYNANGNLLWDYFLSSADFDAVRGMALDGAGNVYLTGAYGFYTTIKLRLDGAEAWLRQYGTQAYGYHYANAIRLDGQTNVIITGAAPRPESGNDFATIKYTSGGAQLWVERYNGPFNGDDQATALAVDASGNVYVAGWSQASSNLLELVVIKYVELENIQWLSKGAVLLQFPAAPGQSVRFQASTNLTAWQDIATVIASPDCIARYTDTTVSQYPHRFYRLAVP